ncbi:MAG: translocation/assembly module TamB domain-containing protein, partial [Bdellovibrionales bacterium]|nr:translocation/assembly module TamB domain-containing protein [Bdellovibrionales bacterium]
ESLTSIGIGSLIMDQFQINEGLSSTLGLRLSLTPEFSDETEIDPLSSRTSSTGGATSKVRSATRIKIKKKITDKLDMSLSSTVGGSIEQKQEMNVDYNINKNILLQGIYEVKSTNEQESSEDPTSLGADIRFRWFFK